MSTSLKNLSTQLINRPDHKALIATATRAPFLHRAGFELGHVDASQLCQWLYQDTHYTQSYEHFAFGLLSAVRTRKDAVDANSSEAKALQHALELLLSAIANVRREQKFFDEALTRYSLKKIYEKEETEAGGMKAATQNFAALFDSFADKGSAWEGEGSPIENIYIGLVVLWTTEWCYYTAWSYVGDLQNETKWQKFGIKELQDWFAERPWTKRGNMDDHDNAKFAVFEAFVPNWTSRDFLEFVKECDGLMGEFGGLVQEERRGAVRERAEETFRQVLELESAFWPVVEE